MKRLAMLGIALAATSAASGWLLGNRWPLARSAPDAGHPAAPEIPLTNRVLVFQDGTVSVQIRRAPLGWLYDELARQGGMTRVTAPVAKPGAAPTSVEAPTVITTSDPPEDAGNDSTRIRRALREGDEAERVGALLEASASGADLPGSLLQNLIDTDSSDQVRRQALIAYVDRLSTDPNAVIELLERSTYNPSAAVREESNDRLEMFDQRRRVPSAGITP